MTDAIDTLLRAADKKSGDQPVAIGQPFSTSESFVAAAAVDADVLQNQREEQPEPAPKQAAPEIPVPNKTKMQTDGAHANTKKEAPALSAPMLPIPTQRHLPSYKKPNAALTFPEKLMHMMTYADSQCATDPNFCVAWTDGGSAFVVQDPDAFTRDVVPRFFKATKFASFTRKLYRWGFRQINRGSTVPNDPIIFSNDSFHRDHKHLMANMRSTTNKKQKLSENGNNGGLSNLSNTNAINLPHGIGMRFNNFSALPQMDGSGMAGMAGMSMAGMQGMPNMGMAFPPGMAMGLMQNNAAKMMSATVTAGTNTPDGGAGMLAGSGTSNDTITTPNNGVVVSAGMKRKAQDVILDSLDSLDPTKAPGWNQLPSEERIRILQKALDTSAAHFAATNAEQRTERFLNNCAVTAPSTTPPTASGSALPNLDQLQHFQQQHQQQQHQQQQQQSMFAQGRQAAPQSSLSQQQNFACTTLAEHLRTAHQKYSTPLPQDVASQQQTTTGETNITGTDLPNTNIAKMQMMGSLPNTGLNNMLVPQVGMMLGTDVQQQQQQQLQLPMPMPAQQISFPQQQQQQPDAFGNVQ